MKLTLSWLKKYLTTDATIAEIIDGLTQIGLEVESVINQADIYAPFIIAEVISTTSHPEAGKLNICQVNNGTEILQIVCGAKNVRAGLKVALAPIGAKIPINNMVIKKSKIRNVESNGMLCSSSELNLGDESDGIMDLNRNYVVGTSFATSFGLNEVLIEISVTPNRGDCLGIYGIARDLAAAGFGKLNPLEIAHNPGSFTSPIKVELKSPSCPKYIGRYFKEVSNKQSPEWLQKDLKSIGLKPISSLVDITNYFTFAFGRPLHVFDADLINNIEVTESLIGDKFIALNDKEYTLPSNSLIIQDGSKILGLAGIIGDKHTGVSENTKNVFLEIGLFDSDNIAKTSRSLQIESDAKFRFERKIDSEFMLTALDLATQMINDICGGNSSHPIIIDNLNYTPKVIDFPLLELKKRIGMEYPKEKVIEILLSLGFKLEDKGDNLLLTVPSWRHEISMKENIVGEIARIYGYNNIKSISMNNTLPIKLDPKQSSRYNISRFIAGLGLDEVITMSFMNSKKAIYFSELHKELYLKNPISSELNYMRPSILPNLLDAVEKNQNRGINNVRIFENSSIFKGINPQDQIPTITGLRSGFNNERSHYQDQRPVDIFDSKSDIFNIISEMGLDPSKLKNITDDLPTYYHPGRSAALALGKVIVGYFGQIHPKILQNYGINNNVVGFELFLDNLPLSKPKFGRKGSLEASDYQFVTRDFAFLINKDIMVDSIMRSVVQIDKKLIKDINIFDIFTGNHIEEGKKSVGFTVTIQANDRTLSDIEIDQLSQKIIDIVTETTKGVLRSA